MKIRWHHKRKYIQFNALDKQRCMCTYCLAPNFAWNCSMHAIECSYSNKNIGFSFSNHTWNVLPQKSLIRIEFQLFTYFSYLAFGVLHTLHRFKRVVDQMIGERNTAKLFARRGVAGAMHRFGTTRNRWPPAYCRRKIMEFWLFSLCFVRWPHTTNIQYNPNSFWIVCSEITWVRSK